MPSKAVQIAETDELTDLNITDGTAGQVLTTDGASSFSFQDGPTSLTDLGITDGTAGQILSTDGASSFSFQNPGSASGEHEFIATGAISNGNIVGLRSDGTVEVCAGTVVNTGLPAGGPYTIFEEEIYDTDGNRALRPTIHDMSAVFDPSTNKVVIAYAITYYNITYTIPDPGPQGRAVVGTVSGTSISFGTPVVFETGTISGISTVFDSNSNKVVIAYTHADSQTVAGASIPYRGSAVVGTVSGDSITFGPRCHFNTPVSSRYQSIDHPSEAIFDSNSNKVVWVYNLLDLSSGVPDATDIYAVVGTVSGNSITFGTPVFCASREAVDLHAAFDSNTNKVVISYIDQNQTGGVYNNRATAIVGTVSGNSITFGTGVDIVGGPVTVKRWTRCIFDSNTNKVVVFIGIGSPQLSYAFVGTVSGNSITFGTSVSTGLAGPNVSTVNFDTNINKIIFTVDNLVVLGTVSGNSITFTTSVSFAPAFYTTNIGYAAAFDSNSNILVYAHHNYGPNVGGLSVNDGRALLVESDGTITTVNADTWIGIAAEDIADTTSGTVKIMGGVAEGLTGLTTGACYYVNYDGTLTATENAGPTDGTYGEIGTALSSTTLLITSGNC